VFPWQRFNYLLYCWQTCTLAVQRDALLRVCGNNGYPKAQQCYVQRSLASLFGVEVGWTSCKPGYRSGPWRSLPDSSRKCVPCRHHFMHLGQRATLSVRQDVNAPLSLKRPSQFLDSVAWTRVWVTMSFPLDGASRLLTVSLPHRCLPPSAINTPHARIPLFSWEQPTDA
jgi:hypothetical protein